MKSFRTFLAVLAVAMAHVPIHLSAHSRAQPGHPHQARPVRAFSLRQPIA